MDTHFVSTRNQWDGRTLSVWLVISYFSLKGWHILNDQEAHFVTRPVPEIGLDLDVFSNHVHANVLEDLKVVYHRFVGGWRV